MIYNEDYAMRSRDAFLFFLATWDFLYRRNQVVAGPDQRTFRFTDDDWMWGNFRLIGFINIHATSRLSFSGLAISGSWHVTQYALQLLFYSYEHKQRHKYRIMAWKIGHLRGLVFECSCTIAVATTLRDAWNYHSTAGSACQLSCYALLEQSGECFKFFLRLGLTLLQESYFTYSANEESLVDHDVHFRPGIGADGTETFTPRTVIYDLKGGFGSLRKINALYEIEEEGVPQALWYARVRHRLL